MDMEEITMWPFDRIKNDFRRDTRVFHDAARTAREIGEAAAADQTKWKFLANVLRGKCPPLSDDSVIGLQNIRRTSIVFFILFSGYIGYWSKSGHPEIAAQTIFIWMPFAAGVLLTSLMLRAARIPESRRLEYKPEKAMPLVGRRAE
jgi:hypothetical protein